MSDGDISFPLKIIGKIISMKNITPAVNDLLTAGIEAKRNGDILKSREYHQSALTEAKRLKDACGEATALLYLATIVRTSDKDLLKARKLLNEALQISNKVHFDRGRAYAMCEMAGIAYQEGKSDEALKWLNDALVIFDREQDKQGKALALHQMGYVDKYTENYTSAEKRWRESLLIFEGLGDRYAVGNVLLSLGSIRINYLNDIQQGKLLLSRALSIFEELGLAPIAEKLRHDLSQIE